MAKQSEYEHVSILLYIYIPWLYAIHRFVVTLGGARLSVPYATLG